MHSVFLWVMWALLKIIWDAKSGRNMGTIKAWYSVWSEVYNTNIGWLPEVIFSAAHNSLYILKSLILSFWDLHYLGKQVLRRKKMKLSQPKLQASEQDMGFPASDGLEPLIAGLFGDLQQSGSLTLHRHPWKSGRPWSASRASPSQF